MNGTKIWWSIDAAFTRLTNWVLAIPLFFVVAIMLLVTVDIITTKFFHYSVPSATEFVEDLNIPMVFIGMAYVQLTRGHIAGPVFEKVFPGGVNRAIALAGHFSGLFICGLISWRLLPVFQEMWVKGVAKAGVIQFPLWPFALGAFIGFVLLTVAYILSIVRELKGRRIETDSLNM